MLFNISVSSQSSFGFLILGNSVSGCSHINVRVVPIKVETKSKKTFRCLVKRSCKCEFTRVFKKMVELREYKVKKISCEVKYHQKD